MLRQTMLEVLNAEARSLGAPPIFDRTLEDWFHEELFERPTEKGLGGGGSEWRYSPAALKAALEVVRLKASGPKRRNTVLRLRLWLLGFDVPINRVTQDLESEFSRLLRRRFFRNPFGYGARSDERELRRAGPPDPSFVEAELSPPPQHVLGFASEATWGSAGRPQLSKALEELVLPFLSEQGQTIFAVFLSGLQPYLDGAGLFGNPEEIERSGLEDLANINETDLLTGRRFYQFVLAMADCAERGNEFLPPNIPPALGEAASKTNRTLRESDEWCIAGLAVCSIAAHRAITPASGPK